MAYQSITILGNVGADATLSYTPQGIAVSKFSVAVGKVTGKGETKQEKTIWFRVTMWRERAENLTQYIKKGNQIMVVGEIDVNVYTAKDGSPAASLELTAQQVQFVGKKQDGDNAERPGNQGDDYEDVGDIPF